MGLFELIKKLTAAGQNGCIFIQINELTIKIYSNLSNTNIWYYLKHRIPMSHRLFFERISNNKEHKENFCKDLNLPFHFAYCKWFLYNIPQC